MKDAIMRFYNVELKKSVWEKLRPQLKLENIPYEASGCGFDMVHIEFYCSMEQKEQINNAIDMIFENV